jgi:tRNA A37 threonylcarbamoyladenosine dehydratase
MRKLSKGEVLIQIVAIVHDDADDFMGAEIEDYDRNTGIASLIIVDMDDLDMTTAQRQEISTTEAWGQIAVHREEWTEVTSCKWNGYAVINQQQIEERLNEN